MSAREPFAGLPAEQAEHYVSQGTPVNIHSAEADAGSRVVEPNQVR